MVNEFKNAAGVTFPQGFKAAGVKAGIKKSGNLDVAVIYTEKEAVVAGTFTQNAVAAAPVFASKMVFTKPSSSPAATALPFTRNGKRPTLISRFSALAACSVTPTDATCGWV